MTESIQFDVNRVQRGGVKALCRLRVCADSSQASLNANAICDVFLCFCHFPMWCPGSGVVFDCIDS